MKITQRFTIVTPPASEPITLDEVKRDLRIDDTRFDTTIPTLIQLARERCESITGRKLVTQTWATTLEAFPLCSGKQEIMMLPIQAVPSITYYDTNNALQTLNTGVYGAFLGNPDPCVYLIANQSWPATYARPDAIKITVIAGYGAPSAVPATLKRWISATVDAHLENFHASVDSKSFAVNPFLDGLLDNYKVRRFTS